MKTIHLLALAFALAASPVIVQAVERPTDEQLRDANRHGTILVGMNEEEVRKSLGAPDRINTLNRGGEEIQQWVYNNRNNQRLYLYFRGGYLFSWDTFATR